MPSQIIFMFDRSSLRGFNITFLGSSEVGKTSILDRFIADSFRHRVTATCGATWVSQDIATTQGTVRLNIWDTPSQEHFISVLPMYCRKSDALVIAHDLSCPSTFEHCKRLYEIGRNTDPGWQQEVHFVGNKEDLPFNEVKMAEAHLFAESIGASYHITSAKTGDGVNALFHEIAERLVYQPRHFATPIAENVQRRNDCH
jgi:small GTP-binding protein